MYTPDTGVSGDRSPRVFTAPHGGYAEVRYGRRNIQGYDRDFFAFMTDRYARAETPRAYPAYNDHLQWTKGKLFRVPTIVRDFVRNVVLFIRQNS